MSAHLTSEPKNLKHAVVLYYRGDLIRLCKWACEVCFGLNSSFSGQIEVLWHSLFMELDDITKYRVLGWDFDMTLHGHPNSLKFWDYIYENPHSQMHHIVTFRTGRLFDRIWRDLSNAGCRLLPFQFRGVHGVPDELYEAWVNGWDGCEEYMFWKGKVCRELGIECLIDDATMEVWAGCSEHEIAYVHPDCVSL